MLDTNFKLLKNIEGVRCQNCLEFIWSRHQYDFVKCRCGLCSVDGGRDNLTVFYSRDHERPIFYSYDILVDLQTGHETLLPREGHDA